MGVLTQTEQETEKWSFFESSSLSSLHLLPSPFSLGLRQKHVTLTGTVLDLSEPLARAGDQISSSFSQRVAGKGHTLCLESVTWCLTPCATLEIFLAAETDATTAPVVRIALQTKTAPSARGAPRAVRETAKEK